MRIDSLEVQNFKGFEHKKLNFSPQFNVLIGNNGCGKTAILDALAVGMGSLLLGFDGIGTRSIREDEVRHVYRQSGQITKLIPQHPAIVHCVGNINDSNTISWERRLNKTHGKTTRQEAKTIIQYAWAPMISNTFVMRVSANRLLDGKRTLQRLDLFKTRVGDRRGDLY